MFFLCQTNEKYYVNHLLWTEEPEQGLELCNRKKNLFHLKCLRQNSQWVLQSASLKLMGFTSGYNVPWLGCYRLTVNVPSWQQYSFSLPCLLSPRTTYSCTASPASTTINFQNQLCFVLLLFKGCIDIGYNNPQVISPILDNLARNDRITHAAL